MRSPTVGQRICESSSRRAVPRSHNDGRDWCWGEQSAEVSQLQTRRGSEPQTRKSSSWRFRIRSLASFGRDALSMCVACVMCVCVCDCVCVRAGVWCVRVSLTCDDGVYEGL